MVVKQQTEYCVQKRCNCRGEIAKVIFFEREEAHRYLIKVYKITRVGKIGRTSTVCPRAGR